LFANGCTGPAGHPVDTSDCADFKDFIFRRTLARRLHHSARANHIEEQQNAD